MFPVSGPGGTTRRVGPSGVPFIPAGSPGGGALRAPHTTQIRITPVRIARLCPEFFRWPSTRNWGISADRAFSAARVSARQARTSIHRAESVEERRARASWSNTAVSGERGDRRGLKGEVDDRAGQQSPYKRWTLPRPRSLVGLSTGVNNKCANALIAYAPFAIHSAAWI